MRGTTGRIAVAVIGGLGLLCTVARVGAQTAPQAVGRLASLAPGAIQGTVFDEKGAPVAGALVSAVGGSSAFGTSDRAGRFELRTLSPGPYLVRAHLTGFAASRGQIVNVHPSSRSSSSIELRHSSSYPIMQAGIGAVPVGDSGRAGDGSVEGTTGSQPTDDHGELAWRMRRARRGVLKDADLPAAVLADDGPDTDPIEGGKHYSFFGGPARLATNFFSGTPFSGQFNLLTTGSFDSPQQLFTTDSFSRSIAYVSVGAPVGPHADWTVRGALTQGDISSWMVAGSYVSRAPARHLYDVGLSYSTQRYNAGNPFAFQDVSDGSRNAGAVYGFDTFTVSPAISVTYGARYARYDYLDGRSLLSPRVALTLTPVEHFRIKTLVSRRAVAPGAEEFMPPIEGGVWLPPQRTFSALFSGRALDAERTTHVQVGAERDFGSSTILVRGFTQHVADQLVTMFGASMPGRPASLGHYFVGNNGSVNATGWTAGIRSAFAERIHGSVEYTQTRAHWTPTRDLSYLVFVAPLTQRAESGRIHDLSTTLETDVPETSTKVVVLYRVSNGFAHSPAQSSGSDRSMLDSRFDVQVRQSLPFMDFSSAKWEMLVAVRNFFRETTADQSVYDELLVIRPPKRIVGGLTLHF